MKILLTFFFTIIIFPLAMGKIDENVFDSSEYKLNATDCGPKLIISEDGLVAKFFGFNEYNSVRSILPIPLLNSLAINKPQVAFYFEAQILSLLEDTIICIGFCDHLFPIKGKLLGNFNDSSIGFDSKDGFWIDGSHQKFGNDTDRYFIEGNFVGIGIIRHPNSFMELFGTWNGKLLGKIELPAKFGNIPIFPAVTLASDGNSIRVNFGKEEWQFKEFERLIFPK